MSLGIVFKGPEGIVLAADSRVTLNAEQRKGDTKIVLPAYYDNATKLLQVTGQNYVGVVTYGLGAIGLSEPRTAHSFIPEFEGDLGEKLKDRGDNDKRLSVEEFSKELSDFFVRQWSANMPQDYSGPDMVFLVGGYNKGEAYGRVFEVVIPRKPDPHEYFAGQGEFGITWGGQRELVDRLLQGFDPELPSLVRTHRNLSDDEASELEKHLREKLNLHIPYPFLPLQDCVDLSTLLIRTTISFQTWLVGVRGVGGAVDVATVTRTRGFFPVQQKSISGEKKVV